jgi:penicillin amidase
MAETLRVHGVRAPVEIARDAAGTPLIRARSHEDALFGLGYLHASDRPLQLVLQLAAADGRLSQQVADRPELRKFDRALLHMGLPQAARAEVGALSAALRVRVEAYAAGVNAVRELHRRPPELVLLGADRARYETHHALALLLLIAYAGMADGQRLAEKLIVEALQRGVPATCLRELFAPHLDGVDTDLLRGVSLNSSIVDDVPPPLPALPRAAASNNWVVAPWRSATDAALLASDPHLEVNRLPMLMYEAQISLEGGDWLHGVTIPGLPGIVIGRNRHVAWGATYGTADASDFFVERCDGRGRYLRGGAWRPLALRRDVCAGQETVETWESEHGPIEGPAGQKAGDYLAWSWSATGRAAASLEGFFGLMTARSVAEARAALAGVAVPTLNMVLADVQGDVGYQYVGAIPRRRAGWSGLYPLAGWDPANDWQGMVPADELPARAAADFAGGVFATANDRPDQPGGPRVSTIAQPPYRRDRILELLGDARRLTLGDLAHIQYDVTSLQARRLVPLLVAHLHDGEARRALAAWDYRYHAGSLAPTVFENLYEEVVRAVFGAVEGGPWLVHALLDTSLLTMLIGPIDEVINRQDSTWLPHARRDEVLRAACARGEARPVVPWGERHRLELSHLLLGATPLGRRLHLNRGPYPWDGGRSTVQQASLFRDGDRQTSFAPVYHFLTNLGGATSFTNTPGGPSERPWSQRYDCDLERWRRGEHRPLTVDAAMRPELLLLPI